MVVIAHDELIDIDKVPDDMCIDYEPDMFFKARIFIAKYGYAVARDADHRVILKNENNTYAHKYCYTGGVDMWLLDQYDCFFYMNVMSFQLSYASQP